MKKASLIVSPPYAADRIFDPNHALNRDDCLAFFRRLKQALAKRGYELRTDDIHSPRESALCIYNDLPKILPSNDEMPKSHLLLFESHVIRPGNWKAASHRPFRSVFTWNDEFVDNKKYFKINFSQEFPRQVHNAQPSREKLCTLIAGAHLTFHPLELYSERLKSIQWFEKNHPDDFEFYGGGWDCFRFTGRKWMRALNFLPVLPKLVTPRFSSWRGKVDSKIETLAKYKFAICYENARDIPGYITEKIFDCLFAGTIPVYWGEAKIQSVIPMACFVDRREFKTHEDLYSYLKAMTPAEFSTRLAAINDYLVSPKADPFRADYVAEACARVMCEPDSAAGDRAPRMHKHPLPLEREN